MNILLLLIPLSIILVFCIIWGLWWAVTRGQFEQIEQYGNDILLDQEHTQATKELQPHEPSDQS